MVCSCVLISDFVQYIAIGQWESACRSVSDFRALKYLKWSMKHAFFADMGGFVLETRDGVSWSLDANQLRYLIVEGWIKDPMIAGQIILDKDFIND
jgi:hypothetical protein